MKDTINVSRTGSDLRYDTFPSLENQNKRGSLRELVMDNLCLT